MHPSRLFVLVTLPLLTLALGWQLGVRYEQRALSEMQQQLEELYGIGAGSGAVISDPQKDVDISLLWSVWRLLLTNYIAPEEMQTDEMVFGAVRGLVDAVGDPYTTFMDPGENKDFHQVLSGHLQGIGAELELRNGEVIIVAPLKGSPAERAGLLPEDVITEVDAASTAGQSLQDVVQQIRGKKGTEVTLTIFRPASSKTLKVTITRDDIRVPSTEFEVRTATGGAVGYLEINQFGGETIIEVEEILERDVRGKDLKGLIIDLRFNGGGYLEGAVDLVSLFLKEGRVVSVKRRNGEPDHHEVFGDPILPDIPLVILINEGTASASEIVAGALQDHDRAIIIGMKSFGKGTVQEVIDLPGGSSLRVTIARWLTPNGVDLGKEGVVPDIAIERTEEDYDAKTDPQLTGAIEFLLTGKVVSVKTATGSSQQAD